jgi:hypothetical protein
VHPHAYANNKSSANGLKAGDRVRFIQRGSSIYGKTGVVDEFLPVNDAFDGDAYVTWDDGEYATVKHIHLAPFVPMAARAASVVPVIQVPEPRGPITRLLSRFGLRVGA